MANAAIPNPYNQHSTHCISLTVCCLDQEYMIVT